MLHPGESRRRAAAYEAPDHTCLQALAEHEILEAEEERARHERMSGDPANDAHLSVSQTAEALPTGRASKCTILRV